MQEWQRFAWLAMNQATDYWLQGWANVAMAHTPPQAWMALRKMQTDLLRHSAHTIASASRLRRKQNREALVLRAKPVRAARRSAGGSR